MILGHLECVFFTNFLYMPSLNVGKIYLQFHRYFCLQHKLPSLVSSLMNCWKKSWPTLESSLVALEQFHSTAKTSDYSAFSLFWDIYLNASFPDSGGIFQSQLLKCRFMKALPVWNVMYSMTLDTNAIRVCTKDPHTLKTDIWDEMQERSSGRKSRW